MPCPDSGMLSLTVCRVRRPWAPAPRTPLANVLASWGKNLRVSDSLFSHLIILSLFTSPWSPNSRTSEK